jgi:Ni/Co efflux regulator RcnB
MKKLILLVVAVAAVAAPVAAAEDFRSPDTRDAVTRYLVNDLRSPDTRELSRPEPLGTRYDHLEAARATRGIETRSVVVVDDGFDWADGGIGAVAMLGFTLAAVGALLAVGHRRPQQAA